MCRADAGGEARPRDETDYTVGTSLQKSNHKTHSRTSTPMFVCNAHFRWSMCLVKTSHVVACAMTFNQPESDPKTRYVILQRRKEIEVGCGGTHVMH